MNRLTGKIVHHETADSVVLVQIDVQGDVFTSVLLSSGGQPAFKTGAPTTIIFKETEVALARNLSGSISLSNRFKAVVKKIESSVILSKLALAYKNQSIVSIISTKSLQRLNLKEGDEVEWLVKANEVTIYAD